MKKNEIYFITKFIKKNIQKIKYIGIGIFFVSFILTTRTYINYLVIQETIYNTQQEIKNKNNEIAYTENFLLTYQKSQYRNYFFSHKNNIIFPGEKMIKIEILEKEKNNNDRDLLKNNSEVLEPAKTTPQESRKNFIKERF